MRRPACTAAGGRPRGHHAQMSRCFHSLLVVPQRCAAVQISPCTQEWQTRVISDVGCSHTAPGQGAGNCGSGRHVQEPLV